MKEKTKNSRIVHTPVILQMEALECGAACLTMILAYYKKWIPLEVVRSDCGISRDGSNAMDIYNAAADEAAWEEFSSFCDFIFS